MDATKALETGAAAFKKRLLDGELREIKVPELGCSIYAPASVSMIRRDKVAKALSEGGVAWMADVLIQYAKNEEGRPFFKAGHRSNLMEKQDPDMIIRVGTELALSIAPEADDPLEQ